MGSVLDFHSRVAIVDDHRLSAGALAVALGRADHLVEVIDPVSATARPPVADLVLLAVRAGSRVVSPAALTRTLTERGIDVVVLVEPDCRVLAAECVAAGALGIVRMTDRLERLVQLVASRAAGVDPVALAADRDRLLAELQGSLTTSSATQSRFDRLSPKEAEVLGHLMAGRSTAEIASLEYVAVETVRSHIKGIFRKLGVGSQLAAVSFAYQNGWRPTPDAGSPAEQAESA